VSLFRQESLEAKRRKLHGDVILVQPVSFRVITLLFVFVTAAGAAFAASRDYTRKENVIGYITPESGLTTIRADRGGTLTQVFVSEGDTIAVGDPLFESRLDTETADGFVGARQLQSTDVRLSELRQNENAIRDRYRAESSRLSTLVGNLEREVETLRRRRDLEAKVADTATTRREKMERLQEEDTAFAFEVEQAQAAELQAFVALEGVDQQIVTRESNLADTRFQLSGIEAQQQRELFQLRQEIASLEESRTSIEGRSSYIVRSPVAGDVSALQARVGQVVNPAAPIAVILPKDTELEAILLVPTAAAGFLGVGQDVNLLLDPFPYEKFGVQEAVISEVSETPFLPGELSAPVPFDSAVYRVRADLNKQSITAYGNEVELKPGMTLRGDIVTDRRSLLEWLFEPLLALRRT